MPVGVLAFGVEAYWVSAGPAATQAHSDTEERLICTYNASQQCWLHDWCSAEEPIWLRSLVRVYFPPCTCLYFVLDLSLEGSFSLLLLLLVEGQALASWKVSRENLDCSRHYKNKDLLNRTELNPVQKNCSSVIRIKQDHCALQDCCLFYYYYGSIVWFSIAIRGNNKRLQLRSSRPPHSPQVPGEYRSTVAHQTVLFQKDT